MRISMTAALLALAGLGACAHGPDGNPNNQPYADQPGGTIAVQPQMISTVSYDPYAAPKPFADMEYSAVAITPTSSLNMPPSGAAPMPGTAPMRGGMPMRRPR